jgi:nucleoid-associated protein YgaU
MGANARSLNRSPGFPFLAGVLLALAISSLPGVDRSATLDSGIRAVRHRKERETPARQMQSSVVSRAHRRVHVVRPGDTLWDLASRFGRSRDPRRYVFELQKLNGLKTSSIMPGQELVLPP